MHDCHDGKADCINFPGGYNCSCFPEWSGGLNNGTNCTGLFILYDKEVLTTLRYRIYTRALQQRDKSQPY